MNFREAIDEIILTLMYKGFKPLGFGTTRAVFVKDNLIYKIPLSTYSFRDNVGEAELYKMSKKGKFTWRDDNGDSRYVIMAKCRLIVINNIPIAVMEKLVPVEDAEKFDLSIFPWRDHSSYSGDGCQVGRDRNGELKSFDYGHMPRMSRTNLEHVNEQLKLKCYKYTSKFTSNSYVNEGELWNLGFTKSISDLVGGILKEKGELFAFT
jgi:hypothetical protein